MKDADLLNKRTLLRELVQPQERESGLILLLTGVSLWVKTLPPMLMTIMKKKQHKENLMNCWKAKEQESMLISSQASYEEGSTTIPQGSTAQVCWKRETPYSQGDDIVSSVWKHAAVHKRTAQKKKSEITCTVYVLYSDRDHLVRYVGQTIQPVKKRFYQHIADAKRNDYRVHRWIRKELRDGYRIKFQEIECGCPLNDVEKAWIAHYRRFTPNLTNICEGGQDGPVGVKRSLATRLKMSKPKSMQHRVNMRGARSKETKEKMSLSQIGNTKSRGEANRHAKLKEGDVRVIRNMIMEGYTLSEIAKKYAVQKAAIHKIKSGRTWSHVE